MDIFKQEYLNTLRLYRLKLDFGTASGIPHGAIAAAGILRTLNKSARYAAQPKAGPAAYATAAASETSTELQRAAELLARGQRRRKRPLGFGRSGPDGLVATRKIPVHIACRHHGQLPPQKGPIENTPGKSPGPSSGQISERKTARNGPWPDKILANLRAYPKGSEPPKQSNRLQTGRKEIHKKHNFLFARNEKNPRRQKTFPGKGALLGNELRMFRRRTPDSYARQYKTESGKKEFGNRPGRPPWTPPRSPK